MAHIQSLNNAKQVCDTSAQCNEYQSLLQHEYSKIDSNTANTIQNSVAWGAVIAIIGLVILLTPFIKPFQKLQAFILPKLAIVLPILIGLICGAFVGFAISFSACFKQSCSRIEESAIITIPLAALIITIPITIKIFKKRQVIGMGISKLKPQVWIIVGLTMIALSVTYMISKVTTIKRVNEQQKQYLLESEL